MLEPENGRVLVDESARDARFQRLKSELHEQLISGMNFSVLRTVDAKVLREELRRGAGQLCGLHAELLSQADRDRLIDELLDETLGLGPLEPLMQDPTISDILINGPHCVYVERRGRLEKTAVTFRDLDHVLRFCSASPGASDGGSTRPVPWSNAGCRTAAG